MTFDVNGDIKNIGMVSVETELVRVKGIIIIGSLYNWSTNESTLCGSAKVTLDKNTKKITKVASNIDVKQAIVGIDGSKNATSYINLALWYKNTDGNYVSIEEGQFADDICSAAGLNYQIAKCPDMRAGEFNYSHASVVTDGNGQIVRRKGAYYYVDKSKFLCLYQIYPMTVLSEFQPVPSTDYTKFGLGDYVSLADAVYDINKIKINRACMRFISSQCLLMRKR
ncbi:hypothetical protein CIY_12320 [Butyrivibrio fibrisolvens 16/4]|nr:hypothetical protein CIY_12320 [Butyrivibrio fibrisolvens 16/4]